ncbi:hypothetical protein L1987_87854 [Smallanthus sonchifolius]|nr:hypothetical protein L1987_87854 [Smallanthus sonchifolius]
MWSTKNLSSRGLSGEIATALANITMIELSNITGNNFTQPLPAELLAKSKKGLLWLSTEESSGEESRNNKHNIVVILAAVVGCIVVFSIIIILIVKQLKKKALIERDEVFTPRKQQFTYSEVVVAVKMLSESSYQGYKEFKTEVKILKENHHKNITSLIGYCYDSHHKGIIYEFMANRNLEKHLFDECPNVLSWERRLQIGCDAAKG